MLVGCFLYCFCGCVIGICDELLCLCLCLVWFVFWFDLEGGCVYKFVFFWLFGYCI